MGAGRRCRRQLADGCTVTWHEAIDQRRLADAGLSHQHAGLASQQRRAGSRDDRRCGPISASPGNRATRTPRRMAGEGGPMSHLFQSRTVLQPISSAAHRYRSSRKRSGSGTGAQTTTYLGQVGREDLGLRFVLSQPGQGIGSRLDAGDQQILRAGTAPHTHAIAADHSQVPAFARYLRRCPSHSTRPRRPCAAMTSPGLAARQAWAARWSGADDRTTCFARIAGSRSALGRQYMNDAASRLIWIDLEMTGLDSQRDSIIEIATIVTDADLNVVAEGPGDSPFISRTRCWRAWMSGIPASTAVPA